TCLRLCEIRHVSLDHSWRNSIYTNSARSENRSEVLDERLDGSLGRGVSKDRATIKIGCAHYGSSGERRDQNNVRALSEDGQDLLYQEKGAAHVGCEEIVKVLGRMIPDRRTLADPRVAHKHVQSPAA